VEDNDQQDTDGAQAFNLLNASFFYAVHPKSFPSGPASEIAPHFFDW
jgi:hypothetical protein